MVMTNRFANTDPFADTDMTPWYKELAYWSQHAKFFKELFSDLTSKYCPLELIFYRPTTPKLRKVANPKTRMQNMYSYCSVTMLDFNELGTIKRMLKHKGFRDLIAIIEPNAEDVDYARNCRRHIRRKFRSLEEIRLRYDLENNETSSLEQLYPSKAFGQLRMFW